MLLCYNDFAKDTRDKSGLDYNPLGDQEKFSSSYK